MKSALLVVSAAAFAVLAISCGGSPSSSIAAPSQPGSPAQTITLAGSWTGMGIDSQGETVVNWSLTQTGNTVSGTVKTQSVNPTDGSCNSCHRNKSGTFTGTASGSTMTLTMFFAAGADGDPTPACQATMTGTASPVAENKLNGLYSGSDSCEGPFLNGTLAMMRQQ